VEVQHSMRALMLEKGMVDKWDRDKSEINKERGS
jgi:hypothetical protein